MQRTYDEGGKGDILMPIKSFQIYLEKRFTKAEIKDIERQAKLKKQMLKKISKNVKKMSEIVRPERKEL